MTRGHNRGHNRKYKGAHKRKKSSRLHFVRGKVAGHRTQVAPIVEDVWDQKKTLRQNYQALGLSGNVNRSISENSVRSKHPGKMSKEAAASASAREGVEWVDLDSIPRPEDERSRRVPHNMSEEEQIYVSTLIERHGVDYKAMAGHGDMAFMEMMQDSMGKRERWSATSRPTCTSGPRPGSSAAASATTCSQSKCKSRPRRRQRPPPRRRQRRRRQRRARSRAMTRAARRRRRTRAARRKNSK